MLGELFYSTRNKNIRLIGLRISTISQNEEEQLNLFEKKEKTDEKQQKMDRTIDYLKEKYGYDVITRAGKMNINKLLRLKE